jgi:molybdate transport system ATP-binding protein
MDERKMTALLSELGIGSAMLERGIEHLSGGEKQRVALVRALLPGPSVLLTDEPTSALDPLSEDKVINMLRRLKESISLIVVSHSTRFLDMADEIVLISGGRITDRRPEIDEAEFREFLEREENSGG